METKDLENMQANILKPHGRSNVWCLFINFNGNRANSQNWISQYSGQVTTASKQLSANERFRQQLKLDEAARDKDYDKEMVNCLFLTAKGYKKLGFRNEQLPIDKSFKAGMKSGEVNGSLGDPPSIEWEPYYSGSIDAMILLANNHENILASEQAKIMRSLMHLNAGTILFVEKGNRIPYKSNSKHSVEHFGYMDGMSNPKFEFDKNNNLVSGDINLALVQDMAGGYGSYLVYRKLEQNVRAFNQQVSELADELGIEKEFVEAQVIGRFKDGTPLEKSHKKGKGPEESIFDFKDDADGKRCPFHAHIRKVNPRIGPIVVGEDLVFNPKKIRIIRRGITYGSRDKNLTDEPENGVGVLFMCYQQSIEKQFELIQKEWCNSTNFIAPSLAEGKVTGIDPIIGQKINGIQTQRWNTSWHGASDSSPIDLRSFSRRVKSIFSKKPTTVRRSFRNVVNMKGGEYFYAPSIAFLRKPVPPPQRMEIKKTADELVSSIPNGLNLTPFNSDRITYP